MTTKERQKLAYDMRKSGKTWREIGEKLGGITVTRAMMLARKYERKKRGFEQASTGFEKKVALRYGSSKLVDCLRKSGLSDSPDKIVRLGVQELLKLKNINRRRHVIISSVLEENGYIQDAKVWIKNTSNDNMAIS